MLVCGGFSDATLPESFVVIAMTEEVFFRSSLQPCRIALCDCVPCFVWLKFRRMFCCYYIDWVGFPTSNFVVMP